MPVVSFFSYRYEALRDLHSFPTRRSSDLLAGFARRRIHRPHEPRAGQFPMSAPDRKSTRLNSSHRCISYAVFCLKKKSLSGTTAGVVCTEISFPFLPEIVIFAPESFEANS